VWCEHMQHEHMCVVKPTLVRLRMHLAMETGGTCVFSPLQVLSSSCKMVGISRVALGEERCAAAIETAQASVVGQNHSSDSPQQEMASSKGISHASIITCACLQPPMQSACCELHAQSQL
jgi:hypothetical protein